MSKKSDNTDNSGHYSNVVELQPPRPNPIEQKLSEIILLLNKTNELLEYISEAF